MPKLFTPLREMSLNIPEYIEAFNSILETEALKAQYFNSFEEVYASMVRVIEFYKNKK